MHKKRRQQIFDTLLHEKPGIEVGGRSWKFANGYYDDYELGLRVSLLIVRVCSISAITVGI